MHKHALLIMYYALELYIEKIRYIRKDSFSPQQIFSQNLAALINKWPFSDLVWLNEHNNLKDSNLPKTMCKRSLSRELESVRDLLWDSFENG